MRPLRRLRLPLRQRSCGPNLLHHSTANGRECEPGHEPISPPLTILLSPATRILLTIVPHREYSLWRASNHGWILPSWLAHRWIANEGWVFLWCHPSVAFLVPSHIKGSCHRGPRAARRFVLARAEEQRARGRRVCSFAHSKNKTPRAETG